jgi:acyl dehydratase
VTATRCTTTRSSRRVPGSASSSCRAGSPPVSSTRWWPRISPGPGSVFLHVEWSFTAPVRPGDDITAEVEVLEARADKPITKLRTTITRADGVVALQGTALVSREELERQSDP